MPQENEIDTKEELKPACYCANFECNRKEQCLRYVSYETYLTILNDGKNVSSLLDSAPEHFVKPSCSSDPECVYFYPLKTAGKMLKHLKCFEL